MKAECHDTFVSNCLELCAIMSPPLLHCPRVYRPVFTQFTRRQENIADTFYRPVKMFSHCVPS